MKRLTEKMSTDVEMRERFTTSIWHALDETKRSAHPRGVFKFVLSKTKNKIRRCKSGHAHRKLGKTLGGERKIPQYQGWASLSNARRLANINTIQHTKGILTTSLTSNYTCIDQPDLTGTSTCDEGFPQSIFIMEGCFLAYLSISVCCLVLQNCP